MVVTLGCTGQVLGSPGNLWPMRSDSVPLVSRQGSRERRRKEERGSELATECCTCMVLMCNNNIYTMYIVHNLAK